MSQLTASKESSRADHNNRGRDGHTLQACAFGESVIVDTLHSIGLAIVSHRRGNTHVTAIGVEVSIPIGDLDNTVGDDVIIEAILLEVVGAGRKGCHQQEDEIK